MIQCSQTDALQFQIALFLYNLELKTNGVYEHPFEVRDNNKEGLFIYAEDLIEENFDSHICHIISESITAAGLEIIEFTYCVIGDGFSPTSHFGGTIEIYNDAPMKMF
jgi:hypothetical protein